MSEETEDTRSEQTEKKDSGQPEDTSSRQPDTDKSRSTDKNNSGPENNNMSGQPESSGSEQTDNSGSGSIVNALKTVWQKVLLFARSDRRARIALAILAVVIFLLFMSAIPLYVAPALQHSWGTSRAECRVDSTLLKNRAIQRQIRATENEITRLERRLASFIPTQTYLVINTVDNRFSLYRNRKLVREGFCSSGSYTLLRTEDGEKEWIFKTPRGRFTIQGKITHPVWRKPDWAFVEEGLPIPGPTDASRYEYGVLGDYAMSLGDGYLIHGTLYKRLLGMPVTHGCIRLNDDDLEAVFNALSVGSKVYIY